MDIISEKKIASEQEADKEILKTLKEHGDDENIVRPVFHYCIFNDKEALKNLLSQLKQKSISASMTKKPLGAVITMPCDMVEENILRQIKIVSALVTNTGGTYDGWETSIEKNKER